MLCYVSLFYSILHYFVSFYNMFIIALELITEWDFDQNVGI